MSLFTTFGSFSIAAGVLLIFLIFVMLAAERRGELGIARAIGTRRRHLVQMFLFEGLAYDLLAAAVGALLGIAVAYLMVLAMASGVRTSSDVTIDFSVKPASVVIAYAHRRPADARGRRVLGLAREPHEHRQRDPQPAGPAAARAGASARWLAGSRPGVLGALLIASGVGAKDAIVARLRRPARAPRPRPDRAGARAPTTASSTRRPGSRSWCGSCSRSSRWLLGDLKTNFSMFILAGLAIVVGASWALMYNADVLLGALTRLSRTQPAAGAGAQALAGLPAGEPLPHRRHARDVHARRVHARRRERSRPGSFVSGFNNVDTFGGGFDIRATTAPASPIRDMRAALAHRPGRARRRHPRRLEPVAAADRGAAGRRDRGRAALPRARRRPRVPRAHDVQARRHGEGLRIGGRRLARAAPRTPEPRRRRLARRAAQAELQLRRRRPTSCSRASTSRTRRSRPSTSSCATPRPAGACG